MLPLACGLEPSGLAWTPPEHYRDIWAEAEACTGRTGDFDRVQWYLIPGHDFKCDTGECIGQWDWPHAIEIAEAWQNVDWVVKHEMVHDLTGYTHDHGPRDIQVWGVQCHATWGFLQSDDPRYVP